MGKQGSLGLPAAGGLSAVKSSTVAGQSEGKMEVRFQRFGARGPRFVWIGGALRGGQFDPRGCWFFQIPRNVQSRFLLANPIFGPLSGRVSLAVAYRKCPLNGYLFQ